MRLLREDQSRRAQGLPWSSAGASIAVDFCISIAPLAVRLGAASNCLPGYEANNRIGMVILLNNTVAENLNGKTGSVSANTFSGEAKSVSSTKMSTLNTSIDGRFVPGCGVGRLSITFLLAVELRFCRSMGLLAQGELFRRWAAAGDLR